MKVPGKPGVRGWVLVGAVVLAVEMLDDTTLSAAFRDFSRTPTGRIVTWTAWTALTAHLFGFVPEDRDPIRIVFSHVPHRTRKITVTL